VKRRAFLGAAASAGTALAWPLATFAQATPARVGVLVGGIYSTAAFLKTFREGMHALGHVEGRTFHLEIRSAEGQAERLQAAAELVRLKVDVVIALQTPNAEAVKSITSDIPMVMATGDPVGTGLVASLARPGGNITGFSTATAEAGGKCVQILRDILPALKRVAAICNSLDPFSALFLHVMQQAGTDLGVTVSPVFCKGAGEIETAFAAARTGFDAAIIQPSLGAARPAELAVALRLPAASPNRGFAQTGGLLSYSGNQAQLFRDTATFVDKILKGARPADMPVQQPTTFDLVINMKTAAALGLTISPTILATADEVIE
jgi:putative ABC transport system substrate-binding protein